MIRHAKYHSIDSAILYGLAVLSILTLSNLQRPFFHHHKEPKKINVSVVKKIPGPVFNKNVFSNVSVQGRAYVVYDILEQEVIAGKNADMIVPLASITKVMTAVTARTYYDKKRPVKIGIPDDGGIYDLGLQNGQVWNLEELLKYTLVFSSNEGARAIANELGGRKYFVGQMNTCASSLGLDMKFTDPSGLDEDGQIGGLGSALSVAKLFRIGYRNFPELFDVTTKKRLTVIPSTGKITGIPNTNQDVSHFPGIMMSKTGFTDKAGGNLAVIVDVSIGRPVVIVVLGSTRDARFSDVRKLYDILKKSIAK